MYYAYRKKTGSGGGGASADIAFDSATNPAIQNPGTTLTYAHTCSGSNRFLYVGVLTGNATVSSVTYNGVAMTEIGSRTAVGSHFISHYYLIAPATGSNNVVVTVASSVLIISGATSYTGVAQTSPIDASATNAETTETTTTTNLTTTTDNCWTLLTSRGATDGNTNAGTGTTQRADTAGYIQLFDSNGVITPAGSTSLQTTQSSQSTAHQMAAIKPA